MELVYAALLLHESGKDITEDNLEGVLDGAGIDADASEVKAAVAALEDVDLDEAMEQPAAAAPAAAPADSGGDAAEDAGDDAEAEDAAEEEQADEEAEEAAEEGLGQLF